MHLKQTILWQQLFRFGAEQCQLYEREEGWQLEGTVLTLFDDQPARVTYEVRADTAWHTTGVDLQMQLGGTEHHLGLKRDGQGRWWLAGQPLPALDGCIDVDLGTTPSTNTLPIRRLELPVGGSEEVSAAWVRFPQLTVTLLPQRYTRLGPTSYRYESNDGAFTADLEVDDLGLVVDYQKGWRREAAYRPFEGSRVPAF